MFVVFYSLWRKPLKKLQSEDTNHDLKEGVGIIVVWYPQS